MEKEKLDFQLSDIPDYVRVNLAIASLDLVQQILRQPGGREMLDRETRRRKLEKGKDKNSIGRSLRHPRWRPSRDREMPLGPGAGPHDRGSPA